MLDFTILSPRLQLNLEDCYNLYENLKIVIEIINNESAFPLLKLSKED